MRIKGPRMRSLPAFLAVVMFVTASCSDGEVSPVPQATTTVAAMGDMDEHDMGQGGDDHGHSHGTKEWDGTTTPAIALEVVPDPTSGWNVFADVAGYTFAPEHASMEHVPGEGHAHLYIDGEKLGRVYGTAFHIPKLEPGTREVTFVLSANDHDDYMLDGEPLSASVTVEVPESDGTMAHSHGMEREWDGTGTPTIELSVVEDPKSGWMLLSTIDGYTIAPRAAGTEHVPGQGHMHIYVNGTKLARIYTAAFHIPSLPAGSNEVSLTLSANDHAQYTIDGEPLSATVTVDVEADDAEQASGNVRAISVEVRDGELVGDLVRFEAAVGDTVEIVVTSDATDEVHVHGYDAYGETAPGAPATVSFVADIPGIFEVELEGSGLLILELQVS